MLCANTEKKSQWQNRQLSEAAMQLIRNERVINIMEKTMNHVDSRLIDGYIK